MNQYIESIKSVYAAININDFSNLEEIFDPQIERVEPVGFPSAGNYKGIDELKAHLSKGRSNWAEGTCEPEDFAVKGDKVVVLVHVHVRLKDETDWIDAYVADGFAFKGDKIIQMQSFAEEGQALEWAGIKK